MSSTTVNPKQPDDATVQKTALQLAIEQAKLASNSAKKQKRDAKRAMKAAIAVSVHHDLLKAGVKPGPHNIKCDVPFLITTNDNVVMYPTKAMLRRDNHSDHDTETVSKRFTPAPARPSPNKVIPTPSGNAVSPPTDDVSDTNTHHNRAVWLGKLNQNARKRLRDAKIAAAESEEGMKKAEEEAEEKAERGYHSDEHESDDEGGWVDGEGRPTKRRKGGKAVAGTIKAVIKGEGVPQRVFVAGVNKDKGAVKNGKENGVGKEVSLTTTAPRELGVLVIRNH